jgi:PAS domain S-box-containing protein
MGTGMGRKRRGGSPELELLLSQLPGAFVWTASRDLELTSVSGAALSLIGVHDPKPFVGKSLATIMSGARDGGQAVIDAHRLALEGHSSTLFEATSRWAFDVHVQPIRDRDEIVGAGGIAIDVSKRSVAEQALVESEARFRTLVERMPICTYVNPLGLPIRTIYMSPYVEKLLGFPVERWLTENDFFVTRLHPDDLERVTAAARRTHETGEPFRETYRLIAADDSVVHLLDETIPVSDERGRPLFLQGFLVDVSNTAGAEPESATG